MQLLSKQGQTQMRQCLIWSFAFGLLAHAYGFLHGFFSHDSLTTIYAGQSEDTWKIMLGRVFVPIYRSIVRGGIPLPWFIGIISLLWIGLSAFFIAKLFQMESQAELALLSGFLTVNITLAAMTATYLYELDFDMFALLAAVIAAFLWKRYQKGFLFGMIPAMIALGLYQSYISVTITLIMMSSIMALLYGDAALDVFKRGCRGICMVLGGGVLYIIALKIVCKVTGIGLVDSYNGLAGLKGRSLQEFASSALYAYKDWFTTFVHPKGVHTAAVLGIVNCCVFLVILAVLVFTLVKRKLQPASYGLLLLLVLFLPLGMNLSCVLSGGMVHDLMKYSFWLFYVWVILLCSWLSHEIDGSTVIQISLQWAVGVMAFLFLWNGIQTSNALYIKKDLEQDAALSLMTRVVERLETTPGYVPGTTPVVFVGYAGASAMPGFEPAYQVSGMGGTSAFTYNIRGMYNSYFRYILNRPVMLDSENWTSFQTDPRVAEMPVFPSAESIQELDHVFIVKMSD